jgi:hypothetical protein
VGGIIGTYGKGLVHDCYATGSVSSGGYAGGIAGDSSGDITNCFSTAAVSGGTTGGIVGHFDAGTETMTGCVALNRSITGTSARVLSGTLNGTLPNCRVWDGVTINTTPVASNPTYYSLWTCTQATTPASYSAAPLSWDLSNVWVYPAPYAYPLNYKVDVATNLPILKAFDTLHFPHAVQNPQVLCVENTPDEAIASNMTPFAGAFWKHDQTGERLIRFTIPNTNDDDLYDDFYADGKTHDWGATVLVGNDWIILDTLMTTDPNVGWRLITPTPDETLVHNGNDAGFDANHAVSGSLTTLTGAVSAAKKNIYFRIGLKDTIGATDHRYGVVMMKFLDKNGNPKTQRIWIRQGEEADYLMNPGDKDGSGAAVGGNTEDRMYAAQFVPYNLTATDAQWDAAILTDPTGATLAGYPHLTPQGGSFTDYPSQAGAFFNWAITAPAGAATDNRRIAFSPITTPNISSTTWQTTFTLGGGFWDAAANPLKPGNETCPVGYHRPNDGITTAGINTTTPNNQSEMLQSLFLNPPTANNTTDAANAAFGCYADGFFDRRKMAPGSYSFANTPNAVAVSDYHIAYTGQLFFNPNSYASLFFPFCGMIGSSNGNSSGWLGATGVGGYYSSSASTSNTGFLLQANTSNKLLNAATPKKNAANIRCVKD